MGQLVCILSIFSYCSLLENPFFTKEQFLVVSRVRALRDNKNKPMVLNFALTNAQRAKEFAVQIYCFSMRFA